MSSATAPRTDAPNLELDVRRVRDDFPILHQTIHGRPLVYLDNAATTQKPRVVLEALQHYYASDNANVHRGVHELSVRATQAYEAARRRVQRFLNARSPAEVVFVRGTTEAVNLVAQTYGRQRVRAGDEIIISILEHHSNIVPWQVLSAETGATLRVLPLDERGRCDLGVYRTLLNERTRLVAVAQVSNVLGTINPVRDMIVWAHELGVPVLVDGAQAVPHLEVDVQALDCDFYVFSGHKVYGPMGIGVLYGKRWLLQEMPPYQAGGEMISRVTLEKTTYAEPPHKFEAGTPNVAGAIGLASALDYLIGLGRERIAAYERDLREYAVRQLSQIPGVRLLSSATEGAPLVCFTVEGVHPHDVGSVLDTMGVAIRTGHHCAQPLMDYLGHAATCRASFAFYNTREEIDALAVALRHVIDLLKG